MKNIFKEMGVKPTLKGFYYWPVAVSCVQKLGQLNFTMEKDVYKFVAKEFKTTESSVERGMRTLVENYQEKIKNYFQVNLEKVTNKQLIVILIEKISK